VIHSTSRGRSLFAGKNIVMVDDGTLVELSQRFLEDPRTSDAEIRRLSRLALLRYEDFRLQLIAWSLNPPASSLPNSAAMTSRLQHHEPVPRKDRAVPLECTECHARYIAVWSTIRRIGSRTALNATRRSGPCRAAPSIACSQESIECAKRRGASGSSTPPGAGSSRAALTLAAPKGERKSA
jgi:hypothetical protein